MGITLYDEELEKYLGKEFYEKICFFVQQGKLNPERETLEEINRALNPNQAGKFQNSRSKGRLAIREILSIWYNSCPSEVQKNGQQIFLDVLNCNHNIDLSALASKLLGNNPVPQARPISPFPNSPVGKRAANSPVAKHAASSPAGKRAALIVGNTYSKSNHRELPGCKISAEDVKQVLETKGFACKLESNVPADELLKMVNKFSEQNKDCKARLLYFSGHGGNDSFKIKSEGRALSKEKVEFTGNSGQLLEGGDYVIGEDGEKVFKDQIMSRFAKDNQPDVHKILIFDCCRGVSSREMGGSQEKPFHLEIMRSEEADQGNVHYKNVVILHSTLPHQVAWCEEVGKGPTKFSTHFCAQLQLNGVNISAIDEAINAELEKDQKRKRDTRGHVQMVEMTKRGISKPFIF